MMTQERFLAGAGMVVGVVAVVMFVSALTLWRDSPRELYEAAKRYEQQADKTHASELYQQVVANYPDSHFARYSNDRLHHLRKGL
jgi:outer membrane protein assembly factor BamD (BamD/ComL family)